MDHFFQNIEGWFSFPSLYAFAVHSFPYGKFVEVGTWMGRSASFMAVEIANSKKDIDFYCVDTWQGSEEHQNDTRVIENKLFDMFLENISPAKHLIKPMRMRSDQAAYHFKDKSLDFVFIDASHTYEDVKKDLELWYPKIKDGGLFCGHDYPGWEGVKKAVDEWTEKNSITLHTSPQEECWIVRK